MRLTSALFGLSALTTTAMAALQFGGTNESGMEWGIGVDGPNGKVPGTFNSDYYAPDPKTIPWWTEAGANTFRFVLPGAEI